MSEALTEREIRIREEIFIVSAILCSGSGLFQLEDVGIAVVKHRKGEIVFPYLLFELCAGFFSRHVAQIKKGDSVESV